MLKKLGTVLVILLLFAGLAGCSGGSRVFLSGDIAITENEMKGSYNHFSGNYFKRIKLAEGEKLIITYSVNTEKGELAARVLDETDRPAVILEPGKKEMIDKPGKYTVQVQGEQHKGDFEISWKRKKVNSDI